MACAGEVGAVLCLDASRLARNGRDWHHLLELCGLVDARVIDQDGVYDPCRANDRFELSVLRSRMLEAARAKASRGELRIGVPVGYIWHRELALPLPHKMIRDIWQRLAALCCPSVFAQACQRVAARPGGCRGIKEAFGGRPEEALGERDCVSRRADDESCYGCCD